MGCVRYCPLPHHGSVVSCTLGVVQSWRAMPAMPVMRSVHGDAYMRRDKDAGNEDDPIATYWRKCLPTRHLSLAMLSGGGEKDELAGGRLQGARADMVRCTEALRRIE